MPIFNGGTEITDIKIGTTEINSVWVGGTQVWSRTLLNPESGWNNSDSLSVNNSGAQYSNTVTITQNCTLKFTATALSLNYTSNTTYIEVNSGNGFPSAGASPYYWGEGGSNSDVAYGTDQIISLSAGDQVRIMYFLRSQGTAVHTSITVRNNANQAVIDSNIVGEHEWEYDE